MKAPRFPMCFTLARGRAAQFVNKMNGLWMLPRSISGNRYHFVLEGGRACLCGRWRLDELMWRDGERRQPNSAVDAKACVAAYHKERDHGTDH